MAVDIAYGLPGGAGGDASTIQQVNVAHPLPVQAYALAGQVIAVGGQEVHLTQSPAVTAGAYTTGQVVGGLISFTNAVRASGGQGIIQTAIVTVKTTLTAPYDILFFDTNPTNSTWTDNSNLAVNVADLPFLIGIAHATDAVSLGTPEALQATGLAFPFQLNTGTTLYAVVVIRGSQTYASTSAVQVTLAISQD